MVLWLILKQQQKMSPYLLEVDRTMSKICFKLNPAGVEGRWGPRMKQDGHAATIAETV